MKKTSLRILFSILLLSVCALTCLSAGAFAAGPKEAEFVGAEFESEYDLGYEISLPDVKVIVGGKEYQAEKAIVLPDGSFKVVAKQILSVAGRYTVIYSAVVDGYRYEKEYYFNVKDNLFGLDRPTSSAVYDADNDLIALHLDGNNSFRYNSVVDLSDNDIATPFLEMYTVSSETGERDCERIMVTLTDSDNENNYIEIRINAAPDFKKGTYTYYTSYVAVSVNGAEFQGKDGDVIHSGNAYGRPVRFSFSNNGDARVSQTDESIPKTPEEDRIQLYYVAETMRIYAYGTAWQAYGGLVVDFRSDDFYREFWEGFAVDKCILSVYVSVMKKATADLFVTNIDGQDLSVGHIADNEEPELNISLPDTIPYGIVGYGYEIFDYSARDDYGVASRSVSAYYDYYSKYPVALSIDNGKIYPQYQGIYTLVYSAVDTYGNKSEKTVDVKVDSVANASPISVDLTAVNYSDCSAGKRVDIQDCAVIADGKYGEYTLKISAVNGNTIADIKNGGYFYANAVGQWEITYEVTDRLGRKASDKKTFTASVNPDPEFGEPDVLLPKYLLSGVTYTIPDIKAYRYGAGNTEEITPAVRYELNGQSGAVIERQITPTYADGQSNELVVTYYIDNFEYSFARKIVETFREKEFYATGLFYITDGSVDTDLTETGIEFTANEDSEIDFVTSVLMDTFVTEISMLKNGNLAIKIQDEQNLLQLLEIKIVYVNGTATLYFNDVKMVGYNRAYSYVSIEAGVLHVNEMSFNIKRYKNGDAYVGFDSKKACVSFSLAKDSKVKISKVANQPISTHNKDVISPTYYMDGRFETFYKKGGEIVIPRVYAMDVISGECDVKVTVKMGNKYVTTTDGIELNGIVLSEAVKIIADDYGRYSVKYEMKDKAGNKPEPVSYMLRIPDDLKPDITTSGVLPTEAKAGDKIKLPAATANDNIDGELIVTVFTVSPSLAYETVNDSQIILTEAGVWTVRFFAIDKEGNMTFKDYKINVKGK